MSCPEDFPSNGEGVVKDGQEDAEAESGDQESREKGVLSGN